MAGLDRRAFLSLLGAAALSAPAVARPAVFAPLSGS